MTIEIFKHKDDAEAQLKHYGAEVILVRIDDTQSPIYGFRYIGVNYEILDQLSQGYIIIDEDWTAEEAAKCGLVEIQEEL